MTPPADQSRPPPVDCTDSTFVISSRAFKHSQVFADPEIWQLYTWLTWEANHAPRYNRRGIRINRGQTIRSPAQIGEELDLHPSKVRRLLNKLERFGAISTNSPTKQYTIITVLHYSYYQDHEKWNRRRPDEAPTKARSTSDERPTTNNNEYNPNNDNHPPHTPPTVDDRTDDLPPEWVVVVDEMRSCGVIDARQAVDRARQIGATPEQIAEIITYWRSRPDLQGGSLQRRVSHMAPGTPADQGWPPPPPDVQREQQRQQAAADAQRREREEIERQKRETEQQQAADQQQREREARYGTILDSMTDDDIEQLCHDLGPVVGGHILRHPPDRRRSVGRVSLVSAIERREQQQEGAA